jgi:flagellar motility protein MotE (MotC chaperone)
MARSFAFRLREIVNLRSLILMKLAIIGGVVLSLTGQLQFGDRPSEAAETAAPGKPVDKSASNPSDRTGSPSNQRDGASNTSAPSAAPTTADASDGNTKRRSFLDGLLNLPSFDRSTAQREELSRFLDLAEQKQRQIQERISVLEKRESHLKELEIAVEDKIRSLENEKVLFQQSLQREKELSEDRLNNLVEYYKKMEAKKAAPVLEKLDKDLVVKLFNQIPQKQVTAFLSAMSPERSVEITEYYGRVRSGREYEMLKEMNQFLLEKFDECKGMPQNAH